MTGTVNIGHTHDDYINTTYRSLISGEAQSGGAHSHSVGGTANTASDDTGGGGIVSGQIDTYGNNLSFFGANLGTSYNGDHTHTVTGRTDVSHTHTLGYTNVALASGLTSVLSIGQLSPSGVNILPPYMNVVYVMRVK